MRQGRVVEEGFCDRVFSEPASPYTRMLLDAIPLPEMDPDWLWRSSENEDAA
jgi:ABC-type dipeptide/oligopeptide/nickel transport system ATPase component